MLSALVGLAAIASIYSDMREVRVIEGRAKGHSIYIRLETEPFKVRGRKLVWTQIPESKELFYPGFVLSRKKVRFYGHDGYGLEETKSQDLKKWLARDTEFVSIVVRINGRNWPVRRSLVEPFLDPHINAVQGHDYVRAAISRDGRILKLSIDGSDAAGGYTANFILRRSGNHTVSASDEC